MIKCLFLCVAFFLPASLQADELQAVDRVLNGKSFVLSSGEGVRLASIEAPNCYEAADAVHHAREGEPLGEEVKSALALLLQGRKVHINPVGKGRDRHNRLLGQVRRDDGVWIESEMLRKGFAMVYSFRDDAPADISKMLAAEQEARATKRGIWAHPYYRVLAPSETNAFINRFKIVEGKIVSVHPWHGNLYINFSQEWKGQFAVFIPRKYADDFAPLHLDALVGKTVRVRGWIHYHKAPMIDLTHRNQIEVE